MSSPAFNPFPGLRPFAMDERHLFFGREQQVAELLVRLRENRFLAVVGASGSGKSSLIRAGLLPELHGGTMRKAGSSWRVVVLRPGGAPTTRLAQALCDSDLYSSDSGEELPLRVAVTLERSGLGLVEAVRQAALPGRTNVLVVVDQFEEIFRYTQEAGGGPNGAAAFVRLLLDASRQTEVPVYVVLTMRSDFLGDCSQYPGLAEAINRSEYLVPRLNREQWRRAIEGPVRVGGGSIAPRLVQRLLNDVGEDPDQLPLLQHALMRSWDYWVRNRREQEPLDLDHYEAVGGIEDALSRHADETYALLSGENQRAVAARIFKALTERTADTRGTRRPTRLSELFEITGDEPEEVLSVSELFRQEGRAFLMPPPETALEPATIIDIAHESLMRTWGRLKGWTEEEAGSVRIYARLAETALLWKQNRAGLFGEPDLEIARRWRAQNRPNAAWARRYASGFEAAEEFLDASIRAREEQVAAEEAARQRELEQAHAKAENERLRAKIRVREAQRRVWLAIGLAVVAVALAASLLALRNARMAQSHRLAAASASALANDPELGLLLATNAWHLHPSAEATTLIRKTLAAWPLQLVITNHSSKVVRAVFSPDGMNFATADDQGNLTLTSHAPAPGPVWQRESVTVRTLGSPDAGAVAGLHTGKLTALEFSRDTQYLLSAVGGTVWVWNVPSGDLIKVLPQPASRVVAAGFSPDGDRILTVSEHGAVRNWDWRSPNKPAATVLPAPDGRPQIAAFSPPGGWYAVASDPGTSLLGLGDPDFRIERWRIDGTEAQVLAGQEGDVHSLVFSPDERLIAAVGKPGVVRVWDVASGRLLAVSEKPSRPAASPGLAFQGNRLLAFDLYGVQVFATNQLLIAEQPAELRALHPPLPQPQGVLAASLSPDGTMVVTGGMDGKTRLQLLTGESLAEFLGPKAQVNVVAFSPDARWIVNGCNDARARLWENRSGQFLTQSGGPSSSLVGVSADATRIAGPTVLTQTNVFRSSAAMPPNQQSAAPANRDRPAKHVEAAAMSEDGRFLALGEKAEVIVVDLHALPLRSISTQVPSEGARSLNFALSEDGRLLAFGEKAGGIVVDIQTSPARSIWRQPHPEEVRSLNFAPPRAGPGPRQLAVGLANGTAHIWDFDPTQPQLAAGRDLKSVATNALDRVGFSPDGRRLFGLHYGDVISVWNLASRSQMASFRQTGARCAGFDPQARFLAVGCDSGAVWVWSLEPCRPIDRQVQHRGQINQVAWSHNGLFMVTGGETTMVWGTAELGRTGALSPVAVLGGHPAPITHVAFVQGDRSVVTADLRGGLRRHRLDDVLAPHPRQLIGLAARRLTRGLDADETKVYLR
jgi:WD40 repeat protein/energy-coupling factor transporter ATP-binding protein EcfA2